MSAENDMPEYMCFAFPRDPKYGRYSGQTVEVSLDSMSVGSEKGTPLTGDCLIYVRRNLNRM